jgi:WD40 repeat protein
MPVAVPVSVLYWKHDKTGVTVFRRSLGSADEQHDLRITVCFSDHFHFPLRSSFAMQSSHAQPEYETVQVPMIEARDNYVVDKTLEGHWSVVTDVIGLTGSSYNDLICSTSNDKTTRIWLDPNKAEIAFQPELILRGHSLPVTCVVQLDEGRICTGSKDGLLKVWDPAKNWTTGQCDKTMRGHKKGINCLTRLSDPNQVCSAGDDLTIMVWDLQIYRYICVLQGHSEPILDVIELRSGNLCSASADHSLILWTKLQPNVDAAHQTILPSVGSRRESNSVKMRMTAAQQLLERYSAVRGELYRLESSLITRGHKGAVNCVVELTEGHLCSCGEDKVMKLWDPVRYVCVLTMEGHWAAVNWVVQLRSGLLCSCSDDRQIKLWHVHHFVKKNISTPDDHCVRTISGHTGAVLKVKELADGSLCSCAVDNKVVLWARQPLIQPPPRTPSGAR